MSESIMPCYNRADALELANFPLTYNSQSTAPKSAMPSDGVLEKTFQSNNDITNRRQYERSPLAAPPRGKANINTANSPWPRSNVHKLQKHHGRRQLHRLPFPKPTGNVPSSLSSKSSTLPVRRANKTSALLPTGQPTTAHTWFPSTSSDTILSNKSDWKKHETRHEKFQVWNCMDCSQIFYEETRFRTHHRDRHSCNACLQKGSTHVEAANQVLIRKDAWGCGYCAALLTTWDERCDHVARHFQEYFGRNGEGKAIRGRDILEWDHSNVIRGLLKRKEFGNLFEEFEQRMDENGFQDLMAWELNETEHLMDRLQCHLDAHEVGPLFCEVLDVAQTSYSFLLEPGFQAAIRNTVDESSSESLMRYIDRFDRGLQWPPSEISRNADFQRLDDELEQIGTIISTPTIVASLSATNMEPISPLFVGENLNMIEDSTAPSLYETPIEGPSHRPLSASMTHFAYDYIANQRTTGFEMDNCYPSPCTTNDSVFGEGVGFHKDATSASTTWPYNSTNETSQSDIDAIFSAFIESEAFIQGSSY